MAGAARELELKLILPADALDALGRGEAVAALRVGAPTTARLDARYFDTEDRRLWAAGMALRVRREDGRWVQTLKMEREVSLGVSNPVEMDWLVAGPAPEPERITDPAVRRALEEARAGGTLAPRFETLVTRTAHRLRPGASGLVELALDAGVVRAASGEQAISEAELELKTGSPVALLEAAERVFVDVAFQLAIDSKADRGFRLLTGEPPRRLADRATARKEPPAIAGRTAAEAFAMAGAAYAGAALAFADRVLVDPDPEGPHQLRIHLRRLRALMKAFRPAFDGPGLRRLGCEAKQLGRTVGRLRDADVLVAETVPEAAAALDLGGAAVDTLLGRLAAGRDAIRDEIRASLSGPRWSRLRIGCALFALAVERDRPSGAPPDLPCIARAALERAWKDVERWGKRIEELTLDERHTMRKRLKTLRYTVEIFAPIHPPERTEAFLDRLKTMQDVFGYINDVQTARHSLAARAPCGPADEAAAAVLRWHEARAENAWHKARKRWKRLKAADRFWTG